MSDTDVRPAVIAAMTYAKQILQARLNKLCGTFAGSWQLRPFYRSEPQNYREKFFKIAVEITAGRASFPADFKIYFQNAYCIIT